MRFATAAIAVLLAVPVAAQPTDPCPKDQNCSVYVGLLAGGSVTMASGATGATPFFRVNVELPLWQRTMATRLLFKIDVLGTPGVSLTELDPTTFTTIEPAIGLCQRFASVLNFSACIHAGFGTRLGTDPTPFVKTVRYGKLALRFGGYQEGYLEVSLNADQRHTLDGSYGLAAGLEGAIKLHEQQPGQPLEGANVQLLGAAVLGIQQRYRNVSGRPVAEPQGNYVVLSVAVGK
jgi:hypothetical protein